MSGTFLMRWGLALALGGLYACAESSSPLECEENADCPGHQLCVAHSCRPLSDAGPTDANPPISRRDAARPADEGLEDTAVDAALEDEGVDGVVDAAPDEGPPEDALIDAASDAEPDAAEDAAPTECEPGNFERCGPEINRGRCRQGQRVCGADGLWGPCEGAVEAIEELCNGADDDCDGETDEDFNLGEACDGVGACGEGVWECAGPEAARCSTDPGGREAQDRGETCNGEDDDCDGEVDEGFGLGDACVGECGPGELQCPPEGGAAPMCSTDPGGIHSVPTDEVCNGRDDDCNGEVDEGFDVGGACQGVGACGAGVWECDGADGRRCSVDIGGSADASVEELCDGLDNDCDGEIDEGFAVNEPCEGLGACVEGLTECGPGGAIICSTDLEGSAALPGFELGALCPAIGVCDAGVFECAGEAPVCSTHVGGSAEMGGVEICDGLDNDCDGDTDEDFELGEACDGVGECGAGVWECAGEGRACSSEPGGSSSEAAEEICDGLDNDCDGEADEGAACGGDDCLTAQLIPSGTVWHGDTSDLNNDYARPLCGSGLAGPDQIFAMAPPAGDYIVGLAPHQAIEMFFWLNNEGCGSEEMRSCSNQPAGTADFRDPLGTPFAERYTMSGAPYHLIVDSWADADAGPFTAALYPIEAGETCRSAIELPFPGEFVGTTLDRANDLQACGGLAGPNTPDQVFSFTLGAAERVRVALTSDDDNAALMLLGACGDEGECLNSAAMSAELEFQQDLEPGTYYVVVDHITSIGGAFHLRLERP